MFSSTCIILFCVNINLLVVNAFFDKASRPKLTLKDIKYYTNDKTATLRNNTSFRVPKYISQIEYQCESTYPTRWVFSFNTYEDCNLQEIPKVTKRKNVSYSNDRENFTFLSNVLMKFKKNEELQNLTCRGVDKWKNLMTSAIFIDDKKNNSFKLHLVEGKDEYTNSTPNRFFGGNEECKLELYIYKAEKTYACRSLNDFDPLRTTIINCNNPDECFSFNKEQEEYCSPSIIQLDKDPCNGGERDCIKFEPKGRPGVILCNGLESLTLTYQVETFDLGKTDRLVLSNEEVNHKHFIKLKSKDQVVYDRDTNTFTCEAGMYHFVHGLQWRLSKLAKPEPIHIRRIASSNETREENEQLYLSTVNITFNISEGTELLLLCEAYTWNTYNGKENTAVKLFVENSIAPTLNLKLCGKNSEILCCTAKAAPQASISWSYRVNKDGKVNKVDSDAYNITWEENLSELDILQFPQTGEVTIFCEGQNFLGAEMVNYVIFNNVTSTNQQTQSVLKDVIYIVGGICGILILFLLVLTVIYKIRQQKLHEFTYADVEEFKNGIPDESNNPVLLPYNTQFEIPLEKLILDEGILGSGYFGTVKKGRYGSTVVAIKTVKKTADLLYFKALLSELKVMCYIGNHPHLLNLVGAATENIRKREVYIIFEYCSNGNMQTFLRECRNTFVNHFHTDPQIRHSAVQYVNAIGKNISTRDLVRWSAEIANGMACLSSKHVIHGDLAARNILLTDALTAKVCDFGLSKQLFEYSVYVQKPQKPLPLKWMAVESLRDLEFSIESDVWSFGVTIWELFSLGQSPYPGIQWDYTSWKLLVGGYRMGKPDCSNDSIYKLICLCWDLNAKGRPPFEKLKDGFENELRKLLTPEFLQTPILGVGL